MQSAARSKVRKLRYIAELDSKSACLHQQANEMSAELRALQEGTSRLGEKAAFPQKLCCRETHKAFIVCNTLCC